MRARKKEEEHENLERWLVTYADLITLLLAFFIIMYSMSKIDAKKFGAMTAALNAIFEGGGLSLEGQTGASLSWQDAIIPSESETMAIMRESLDQVRQQVSTSLTDARLESQVRVAAEPRGVVLTIDNAVLFAPGDAHLRDETRGLLLALADILAELPVDIRVEGHTDDVPVGGGPYPSNWELSVGRAMSVLRFFMEARAIPPSRLSASGYGEYRPVAANDTPQGRARNRRVEIVLMPLWERTIPSAPASEERRPQAASSRRQAAPAAAPPVALSPGAAPGVSPPAVPAAAVEGGRG